MLDGAPSDGPGPDLPDVAPSDGSVPGVADAAIEDAELDVEDVEVAACVDGEERECPDVGCPDGLQRCEDGVWGACEGVDEVCDAEDNDCDGRVDEDFEGLDGPCLAGRGACVVFGAIVCDEEGDGVRCDAVASDPVPESCNGEDDDCDGETDEPDRGGPLRRA